MRKIIFFIAGLLVYLTCQASVIPDSPSFRKGRLENGLTYYLCHNERPKGCADFFIAHNVGALQEDDNQNGLAHFLEHMAFNGTEHYPDKAMLEFLAKDGVCFGYNVNAYTSRTETVYNISKVPLVRSSFIDSVLVVLRDWSCAISCEQDAIDAERGVIHEEWRRRDGQRYRMTTKQTELLYRGSKQPRRTVLGDMDIILNFKREEILDFYHRWYRPDMQAIIVTGDYDLDEMEARIRTIFSDILAAVNPEQKGDYAPAAIPGPRFEDMTDPLLRYHVLKVFCLDSYPFGEKRNSEEYFRDQLCRQIVSSVLGERMERCCQAKNTPAKSAVVVHGDEGPYFYMAQFTVSPKAKTGLQDCLAMTCSEIERMRRFGISEDEFEHARFSVAKNLRLNNDFVSTEADNTELAKVCVENFLRNTPCLAPAELRAVKRDVLESLAYADVLPYCQSMLREENIIYSNSYNPKDSLLVPAEQRMRQVVDSVRLSAVKADFLTYEKADFNVNLAPGKILSVKKAGEKDYECWTLSNGAKVWWHKADSVKSGPHLNLEFRFDTGLNAFPDADAGAVMYASAFLSKYAGFAGKDKPSLTGSPSLAGISFFNNTVKGRYAAFSVSSSAPRAEDAFKIAALKFTDPYPCKEANLERAKTMSLQALSNNRPEVEVYNRDYLQMRFGTHPWLSEKDSSAIMKVDMAFLNEVMAGLYGNPAKMELFICSDLPVEQIRSYVERYIASVPVLNDSKPCTQRTVLKPSFKGTVALDRVVERRASPFTEVERNYLLAGVKDSEKLIATADILDHILSARYLAQIREARGGTYHVGFESSLYREGRKSVLESQVSFRTRAELKEILLGDVDDVMAGFCAEGPTPEEMDNAVKYLLKHHNEAMERSAGSVGKQNEQMLQFVRHGQIEEKYNEAVKSIKSKDVRKLARRLAAGSSMTAVYQEQ